MKLVEAVQFRQDMLQVEDKITLVQIQTLAKVDYKITIAEKEELIQAIEIQKMALTETTKLKPLAKKWKKSKNKLTT